MTPEQFLLIAEPLPEPMLLLADDGLIFAANRAVEERLGIPVAWLRGKRLAEVVVESLEEVAHYLRLCCRSRSLVLGAMRLHTNRGEGIDCRMEGSVICPKEEGAPAVLLLRLMPKESAARQFVALNERIEELQREVQRRQRAEMQAREQQEWLHVTLNSIGDGVICTDSLGCVTMMNPIAEFLTGWTQHEARGERLEAVFPIVNEQTRQPVDNPVEKVLRTGVIVGLANHTVLVARDGMERPIDDSAAPIRDESGKMLGVVLIFRDVTDQRRADRELRESEGKLRLLADTIPQLAWMAKPDGDIFWYNRRWYEYTGTTPQQMEGWGWQAVHDPDVLPQVVERWKKSIDTGEPFDMVFPLKAADGQYHSFLTRVNPLRDEAGGILYWFGTNTDITELRQTREALTISEERLRLALVAGRMGVWDWNIRTGDLKWSDSLEPLHGLAPGTFGGTFDHFQQLIYPEDRGLFNAAIQQSLESSGEFYIEFRNVWPGGGIHWIAGSGKVFPGKDGQPLRMIGVGLDVTQRKRAEQTARFLADASAALAVLVDFDSTLQKVASLAVPSFADWATVDLAEADGSLRRVSVSHVDPAKVQLAHEVHRRFPPDPHAPQGVWTILRTGRSEIVSEIDDELLVQSIKDDELLRITRELGLKSYIGVPLTVRGKTIGVITFINAESGHLYDETDLAVAEDLASRTAIAIENAQLYGELRDADRRKDEFLATLAHELRNPLAPIRNGLQVMRLSGSENEVVAETRSMMERQLNQMVRLVDDLLDVSRITRDKLDLKKQQVELAAVIHSAIETSRPLIEQAGHTIKVTLPPTAVHLDADLTRLAQVFSNLLNNSAKYTPPGGRIWLIAEGFENEVTVTVRDNGLGIPAQSLPKIFQMFSQVDSNMERAQGGLGIGLTLVRRLVEMHGGTIEARSDGPGQGSEFTVRLPILELSQQIATIQREVSVAATAQRRILVVDDNRDSASTLGMMLKLMGNDIQMANDGLAAVEAAEQFRPDMILLDIGLPKLNGYDACRRIREQPWSDGMEIIALTGWGQEDDRRRSKEAGFDHHLVKPVDLAALESLLAAPDSRSQSLGNKRPTRTSLRVLVVDDRRDATLILGTLLRTIGHDVRTASDGPSALAAALDYRPDVVLSDIGLPGMSGLEVAKQIRQQPSLQGIVLVAMTGYGEEADRQRSFEAGFDHHLVKPADIRVLQEVLATVPK